jgi:hypothetical protein
VSSKPAQQRGHRSGLAVRVDDQNDRPAGKMGELRGGTGFTLRAGPVEQAHDTFAQDQIASAFELGNETCEGRGPHRPDVEVEARLAACRSVKGRIDEIGAHLGRGDIDAASSQMAQQTGRHQGFAAPRGRGANDHPSARAVAASATRVRHVCHPANRELPSKSRIVDHL